MDYVEVSEEKEMSAEELELLDGDGEDEVPALTLWQIVSLVVLVAILLMVMFGVFRYLIVGSYGSG